MLTLFIMLSEAGFLVLLAVAFVGFLTERTARRSLPGGAPTCQSTSQSAEAALFRKAA